MKYRAADLPECGCKHSLAKKLGDVTTLNITALNAGVFNNTTKTYALNVIPIEATAGFDVRISPLFKVSDFRKLLDSWVEEFNGSVTWSFAPGTVPSEQHWLTPTTARPEYREQMMYDRKRVRVCFPFRFHLMFVPSSFSCTRVCCSPVRAKVLSHFEVFNFKSQYCDRFRLPDNYSLIPPLPRMSRRR